MPEPVAPRKLLLALVLAIAAALRAVHLDAPVIGEHSWRQADTAAMARNFHEIELDLLHPRVDWGGTGSGLIESELPLFPFAVALLYRAVGVDEAWARLLALLLSLATIVWLYRLALATTDAATALWAAAFVAVLPLSVHFGRAVMPEPLMMAASVGGLFHFLMWTRTGSRRQFATSAALVALACTVKLPCLYLGAPLLYLAWCRFGRSTPTRPALWAYAALVLVPTAAWYAHAHRLFLETGLTVGIWDLGDKFSDLELITSARYWERVVVVRFAHRLLTWPGLALFLIGLCLRRRSREERVFDAWLAGFAVFVLVAGRGHYAHNYYQLPVLLPAAVFMGKPLARFLRAPLLRSPLRVALLLLVLGAGASGFHYQRELWAKEDPESSAVLALAARLAAVSQPGDPVISADRDPALLYLAHRKGFRHPVDKLDDAALRELRERGAVFLAGTRTDRAWSPAHDRRVEEIARAHEPVWSDPCCFLIRLRAP